MAIEQINSQSYFEKRKEFRTPADGLPINVGLLNGVIRAINSGGGGSSYWDVREVSFGEDVTVNLMANFVQEGYDAAGFIIGDVDEEGTGIVALKVPNEDEPGEFIRFVQMFGDFVNLSFQGIGFEDNAQASLPKGFKFSIWNNGSRPNGGSGNAFFFGYNIDINSLEISVDQGSNWISLAGGGSSFWILNSGFIDSDGKPVSMGHIANSFGINYTMNHSFNAQNTTIQNYTSEYTGTISNDVNSVNLQSTGNTSEGRESRIAGFSTKISENQSQSNVSTNYGTNGADGATSNSVLATTQLNKSTVTINAACQTSGGNQSASFVVDASPAGPNYFVYNMPTTVGMVAPNVQLWKRGSEINIGPYIPQIIADSTTFNFDGVETVFEIVHNMREADGVTNKLPRSYNLTFSDGGNDLFIKSERVLSNTSITINCSVPPTTGTITVYWQVYR